MARAASFGLYQLRDRKSGGLFPTFYTRRDVPDAVRAVVGKSAFVASTGETRRDKALKVAESYWTQWGVEIDGARKLGVGPVATLEAVTAAVEMWRHDRCEAAAGFSPALLDLPSRLAKPIRLTTAQATAGLVLEDLESDARDELPFDMAAFGGGPAVHLDAVTWAHSYFDRNPERLRSPGLPYPAGILLGRLQVASREARGWTSVPDFDAAFDAAMIATGLTAIIPPAVREATRQRFAQAWLEVAKHEEMERHRAATLLAAVAASNRPADAIEIAPQPAFEPREGDMTIAEVIDAFKIARNKPDTDKQYSHIFRALKEVCGADKPVRALSRNDVRDIHRFLAVLPSNASKIYPNVPLAQAAELAAKDGRKLLSHNTVRSYLLNLSAVCNFAVDEGLMAANPVTRQLPEKRDTVKRRGFAGDELKAVFGGLAEERAANSARFWVPAMLAWTGARANELAQLHTEDIKDVDGTPYIDLTAFDDDGNRIERRHLKNGASERAIPIHSELVAAGLLQFVEMRRAAGEERLFPDLQMNSLGYYSHELSKFFGRHLDRIGLTEPSLTLHSLRHGFKDAGEKVRLPDYILEGLCGWASKSQMAKYGGRCSPARVAENSAHIELIALDGFTLGPPPLGSLPDSCPPLRA